MAFAKKYWCEGTYNLSWYPKGILGEAHEGNRLMKRSVYNQRDQRSAVKKFKQKLGAKGLMREMRGLVAAQEREAGACHRAKEHLSKKKADGLLSGEQSEQLELEFRHELSARSVPSRSSLPACLAAWILFCSTDEGIFIYSRLI